ncbi:MAG: cytidyltransferase [Desulfamplus sp.]|nr:cytidyltransferase [Desulfamplus sp.]
MSIQDDGIMHTEDIKIFSKTDVKQSHMSDMTFTSTNGINKFFSSFPNEVQQYLKKFRSRFDRDEIFDVLDRMGNLNILLVGDTILDDYHYCNVLGTSSKEPVIAVQYKSNDLFAGGVLAIANHLANFAGNIRLMTVLGENDSYEEFILSKLKSNISPFFAYQENAPTIIKRRFIEGYSLNKLFEVYIMDDSGISTERESLFAGKIKDEIAGYDLVVSADFGHGTISPVIRNILVENAPFLALNTQANAGNRGFHTVSCYPESNFISLAEHELRVETRSQSEKIEPLVEVTATKMKSQYFIVTRGRKGCLIRNEDGKFTEVPAFAHKVIDRIGAGDAFFAITAMAAYLGCQPEMVGFIGNVVGAIAVENLGNQKSIEKPAVKKYISSLLG